MKRNTAQEMQDEILRRMSAEKKLKQVSVFFELAKKLNPDYFRNESRRIVEKNSKHSAKA